MNIKEFVGTHYSTVKRGIKFTVHNSYIEIHNNLIILDDINENVNINEVLDIHGECTLYNEHTYINCPINVYRSIFFDSQISIIPGSFVGHKIRIIGHQKHALDGMWVRGYITKSGFIS